MKGVEHMRRAVVLILLFLLPVSASRAAYTLKYDTLRVGQEDGVVKLVLDLSGPGGMKYFTLPNPDRFVVDLADVTRAGDKPVADLSNTPIKNIRTGIRNGDDLRLVVELARAAKGRAYMLPPADSYGHRLVIELEEVKLAKRADVAQTAAITSVPAVATPAPVAVAPVQKAESVVSPQVKKNEEESKAVKHGVPALSSPVSPAATVAPVLVATAPVVAPVQIPVQKRIETAVVPKRVETPPPLQIKKEVVELEQARDIIIAIDAGHGGVDVGAIGAKGTHEKDVVLQIARRLEERVRKEPGMTPLMIRDGDYFVSLRDRINKARTYKADMFISIHADAFPDQRARGSSVYALSQRGATNEAARMLADRENAADLIGGVSLDDKDALLASVLLDLSQNATIEASLDVAGRVLQGLKRVGRVHKQHVDQAGFVVLKSPDIPSILVETAFISNPSEEANLQSVAYQQQLADAIMKGARSYFASNPPPGTRIAAREHVIKSGETLSGIASQYNVSAQILRVTNRLKNDTVRIGQVLQIPLSDS